MNTGSGSADDAATVACAALNLTAALRPVSITAAGIRGQWLRLGAAYRAPETDALVCAMDGPPRQVVALIETALAAQIALLAYAERLGELARWPANTEAETASLHQARVVAERICADALQAIERPSTSAAAAGARLPSTGTIDGWTEMTAPTADDPTGEMLCTFTALGTAAETWASWMVTVEHGTFRPRGAKGRYVAVSSLSTYQRFVAGAGSMSTKSGLTRAQRLATFTPGGSFGAKGHRRAPRTQWTATAGRWGRANTAATVAGSGWTAWQDNHGYATDRRIGRTVTLGTSVAAGALAGGQAGAIVGSAVGTAIMPGAGTVVGATVGGLLGGFAGSEVGGLVGDQLVDLGGEAGDLIGDSLGWVGDQTQDVGGDVLDIATFWD